MGRWSTLISAPNAGLRVADAHRWRASRFGVIRQRLGSPYTTVEPNELKQRVAKPNGVRARGSRAEAGVPVRVAQPLRPLPAPSTMEQPRCDARRDRNPELRRQQNMRHGVDKLVSHPCCVRYAGGSRDLALDPDVGFRRGLAGGRIKLPGPI